MSDETMLPFAIPAMGCKKVTVTFAGDRVSSDGGVILMAAVKPPLATLPMAGWVGLNIGRAMLGWSGSPNACSILLRASLQLPSNIAISSQKRDCGNL